MSYDPFRGPAGGPPYGGGGEYRYGDVGAPGVGGNVAGGYDFDNMDNTYPPQAHTSHQHGMYDMDPSMEHGPPALGGVNGPKDEFDPFAPPPKATGDLRMWRQDHRGHLWAKGSRPACIGRFFCCSVMTVVLLFVSIVLTLAIFLRPPDITFQGLAPIDSSTVQSSSSSLNVSLGLQINVRNPNFFTVNIKAIKAKLIYPINNTQIGGGEEDNIKFRSDAQTSFTFPFMLTYSEAVDPQGDVLKDIAGRCGILPGTAQSNLELDYTITISISILGITISPPFSGNVNFKCPFNLQNMKPLIAAFPALQGLLDGS